MSHLRRPSRPPAATPPMWASVVRRISRRPAAPRPVVIEPPMDGDELLQRLREAGL